MTSKINQITYTHIKRPGYFLNVPQCDVFLASLNHADVCSVEMGNLAKSFLRESALYSFAPYPSPKLDNSVCGHIDISTMAACLPRDYIL